MSRALEVKPEVRIRLTESELKELLRGMPPPVIDSSTSVMEAGYKLGVQAMANKLREGWVVG